MKWILVIEKEATFRTLSNSRHSIASKAGKGLIVTAKGYPDISTRSFLHTLHSHRGCPSIYVLTDFDPHGLSILNTYVHGSSSLAHENDHLAVPDMKRLGIRLEDVVRTQSSNTSEDDEQSEVSGILSMSLRDRRLASSMLASNPAFSEDTHPDWRRELQCMLFLNIKAEIQILGGAESLGDWVDERILSSRSES